MTTAQKQRINHMRSAGESYAVIANAIGIPENTVKSYCRRNNISATIPDGKAAAGICKNCDALLRHTPGKKTKLFCSDQCRMEWWNQHPESVNRKAVYSFVCPVCSTAFKSYGNAHRVYCSRACFAASRRNAL